MSKSDGFIRVSELLGELFDTGKIQFKIEANSNIWSNLQSDKPTHHKGVSFWITVKALVEDEEYEWGIWAGNKGDVERIPEIIKFLEKLRRQPSPAEMREAAIRARFTGE